MVSRLASILGVERADLMLSGKMSAASMGAAAIPRINATRQATSPLRGVIKPPKIPLIPRIRPLTRINIAAARPSKSPPASDAQGVKWLQSTVMVILFSRAKVLCTGPQAPPGPEGSRAVVNLL
jgi:hypothetical protein